MQKRLTILLSISLLSLQVLFAQNAPGISGKVIDAVTKEALTGVSVSLVHSNKGTLTGPDGSFTLHATGGDSLEISHIGHITKRIGIRNGLQIGNIALERSNMAMQEVIVTSNVAVERRTPVAVSTLRASAIEERIGNKEFPELLKTTPSTYVTKSGGGFGDSRINVRGFTQNNVAVMINGVPVNDMENGAVFWSNWAGLSEIASNVQVQRGLGASKLSISAVGGNINIVTKATEIAKGSQAGVTIGNDGYMKYSAGYSTGKGKNGLALSVLGSYTEGAGYVDGTAFQGYNYFATLGWEINKKHTLTITATGAPQWHDQRTQGLNYTAIYGNPKDPTTIVRGPKYSDSWGYYHGKVFNFSNNYYHKPVGNLNYYYKISNKTELSAVLYASIGRGGGTSTAGAINGKTGFTLPKDANGQVRFDDIEKWNTGKPVADFGVGATAANTPWLIAGPYQGQYVVTSSKGVIRRSNVNSHNWYGSVVNLTHNLTPSISLNGGLDLRYYKGIHYQKVDELLGAAAYYNTANLNQPIKYAPKDDTITYSYNGIVKQVGGYLSAEYNKNKLTVFAAGALSNTNYQRLDHYTYNKNVDNKWETDKLDFLGYTVKGGVSYRVTNQHSFFGNIGYFQRAPFFNIVFPSNNELGRNVQNEKIFSTELGYGFRSRIISLNVNVYRTEWKDKNFVKNFPDPQTGQTYRANISGLIANHRGVEFEATARPVNKLEIQLMGSVGDWKYKNNVNTDVYNDNNVLVNTVKLYTENVKVGDAAQTTANISASYEFIKGLRFRGSYYHADDLFANFTPENRTDPAMAGVQAWKLPAYGTFDGMLSYSFKAEGKRITFRLNVDNVFNKKYLAESQDDIKYDPTNTTTFKNDFPIGDNGSAMRNRVYPGFGTTWTLGAKVNF